MSIGKRMIQLPEPSTMRLSANGIKGLNDALQPGERPLASLSVAKNIIRVGAAAAETRIGRTLLGIAPATGPVLGIGKYYPTSGVDKMVIGIGTVLYSYHSGAEDLTTALTGANNDLYYLSNVPGTAITVTYVNPGTPSASLSVVVTGSDIVVNLATDGASAITSTASAVDTAIANSVAANALVTVANAGTDTGVGVVTAMAESALSAWTVIKTGLTTGLKFESCQFNDYLVITNGTDDVMTYNGTVVAALGGTPPDSPFCISAYSRVFLVGLPNMLHASDVADYEEWTDPDYGAFPINDKDGDEITWLYLYRSQVLIFKRHSLYELHGPELGKTTDDWEVMRAAGTGTPNGRTVQELDGVLYWLSDTGVVGYAGGDPQIISAPIAEVFDLINWDAIDTACSGKDGEGRYYLSLPINSDTYPTITLVYNTRDDSWWRWEGWNPMVWDNYRVDDREQLYMGDYAGTIHSTTGTTDDGTAVATEIVFGPSALGVSGNEKIMSHAHFIVSIPDDSTLTAALSTSDKASYGAAVSLTPVKATMTTSLTGADNDLVWTAASASKTGDLISLTYTDPGEASQALATTVSGYDITVSLATDGSGTISSTAAAVKASVEAATALLSASNVVGNTGTGLVTAMAKTYLSGGSGAADGAIGRVRKQLPLASGEGAEVFAPMIKLVGAGPLTIHDLVLDFEGREG